MICIVRPANVRRKNPLWRNECRTKGGTGESVRLRPSREPEPDFWRGVGFAGDSIRRGFAMGVITALCIDELASYLVDPFVVLPVGLKTSLAAKVCGRKANFYACWTGERLLHNLAAAWGGALAGHASYGSGDWL